VDEPRNVTPDSERVGTTSDEDARPFDRAEWSTWSWESRGRNIPWLGVLLVLIGVALLIQYAFPTVAVSTLVLLAIGVAFLVGRVVGGSRISAIPGVIFLALGIAELIEDLGVLGEPGQDVDGLWSAALAIGFLVIWLIDYAQKRHSTWPLWGAGIFGLIAVAQLSGRFVNAPILGALWPILIIVAGVVVLLVARRR
jgi:hypothetical protein